MLGMEDTKTHKMWPMPPQGAHSLVCVGMWEPEQCCDGETHRVLWDLMGEAAARDWGWGWSGCLPGPLSTLLCALGLARRDCISRPPHLLCPVGFSQ